MNSIFEKLGGTYTVGTDGLLYPSLIKEKKENRPIGKWGLMHRAYLKEKHPDLVEQMILSGTLDKHLADAEERAGTMLDQLIRQMARNENVTESLKAKDQMEWIRRMNSIRNRAEEIIIDEVINRL